MVGVSASVNLPLHHKVQKFSSGTGSPEWSRKEGRETVVVMVVYWLLMLERQADDYACRLMTEAYAYDSCCLAVLDPRVGHTMDVLYPFISILCHSD